MLRFIGKKWMPYFQDICHIVFRKLSDSIPPEIYKKPKVPFFFQETLTYRVHSFHFCPEGEINKCFGVPIHHGLKSSGEEFALNKCLGTLQKNFSSGQNHINWLKISMWHLFFLLLCLKLANRKASRGFVILSLFCK